MAQCTVTTQDDVDQLDLDSSCDVLNIVEATGTLNFTKSTPLDTLYIHDSPKLQVVNFPQLPQIFTINITHADSLTTVSLPEIKQGGLQFVGNNNVFVGVRPFSLAVTGAPGLTPFQRFESFWELSLFDTPKPQMSGSSIVSAYEIETDSCVDLSALQDVGRLTITAAPACSYYGLTKLRSVGNLTISHARDFDISLLTRDYGTNRDVPTLRVNDSLAIDGSALPIDPRYDGVSVTIDRLVTITNLLEVRSLVNTTMAFEGFTNIDNAEISLFNNTNCEFSFSEVSKVANITMLDNPDTVLPTFHELMNVKNIHMRGIIDTSGGPNLFPALELAEGTVTIEPWNSDFDCSVLESQQSDRIINHLSCNGTGTGASSPNTSASDRLTTKELAGIGAGVGVFAILVILAIVWLVLHYKHRSKGAEASGLPVLPVEDPEPRSDSPRADATGLYEVNGAPTIEEKPDDHVIGEKPDDHLVELPVGDEEQAGSSINTQQPRPA